MLAYPGAHSVPIHEGAVSRAKRTGRNQRGYGGTGVFAYPEGRAVFGRAYAGSEREPRSIAIPAAKSWQSTIGRSLLMATKNWTESNLAKLEKMLGKVDGTKFNDALNEVKKSSAETKRSVGELDKVIKAEPDA